MKLITVLCLCKRMPLLLGRKNTKMFRGRGRDVYNLLGNGSGREKNNVIYVLYGR